MYLSLNKLTKHQTRDHLKELELEIELCLSESLHLKFLLFSELNM